MAIRVSDKSAKSDGRDGKIAARYRATCLAYDPGAGRLSTRAVLTREFMDRVIPGGRFNNRLIKNRIKSEMVVVGAGTRRVRGVFYARTAASRSFSSTKNTHGALPQRRLHSVKGALHATAICAKPSNRVPGIELGPATIASKAASLKESIMRSSAKASNTCPKTRGRMGLRPGTLEDSQNLGRDREGSRL